MAELQQKALVGRGDAEEGKAVFSIIDNCILTLHEWLVNNKKVPLLGLTSSLSSRRKCKFMSFILRILSLWIF
jgi:hypothetical protein